LGYAVGDPIRRATSFPPRPGSPCELRGQSIPIMERSERLKLIVIKGADEGKQFELSEPVVSIGRDAGNTIRLNDTEVSRRHAELVQKSGDDGKRYLLRDVGSANGTFVNNEHVTE